MEDLLFCVHFLERDMRDHHFSMLLLSLKEEYCMVKFGTLTV